MASSEKNHPTKHKLSRKTLLSIGIGAGCLIVAFGVGSIVSWLQHQNSSNSHQPANVTGLPVNPQPSYIVNSQNLADNGNYTQAQSVLEQAAKATTSNGEKYNIYLQEAANYENQKDYANAIAALQKAVAVQPTFNAYEMMGDLAEMMGNKQLAIDSYTKAISAFTSKDRPSEKQTVQDKLKALGG